MGKTVKAMVTQWLPFFSRKKERHASGTSSGRESLSSSTASSKDKKEQTVEYDEKILWFPAKRELPIIMNSIEDDTDCILCCDVMLNPVTLPCGHSVCQVCLAKAYMSSHHHSLCPVCRLQWSSVPPINYCLRSVIEKLFPCKLAQRRAKNNTWGADDADVLREFERCMRARAALKDNAASAARFRLALTCFGVVTVLCSIGLFTSVMLAVLTQNEPPTADIDDDRTVFMASTFASTPNFVDLQDDKHIVKVVDRKVADFRQVESTSGYLPFVGFTSTAGVDYSLADRFIQRNWLPHGRINQWTTSDVVKFFKNAGLLRGGNEMLQQRLEALKINGSILVSLHEHNVWDSNGLNVTQPGTYHAVMMMIYGLRNLLRSHKEDDPLATFCERGAVNCVYTMLSFYAAPHLFWIYAFIFQYQRYFLPLFNRPLVGESLVSNWAASLLFMSPSSATATAAVLDLETNDENLGRANNWQRLLSALMFPRFAMVSVLLEHYRGHALTLAIWAVIFIGTYKLLTSKWIMRFPSLAGEALRVGVSEIIGRAVASFARKAAIVFAVTLLAWLIPALCYPILYAATSYEMLKILIKLALTTEKIVRALLSYSRRSRRHDANDSNLLFQQAADHHRNGNILVDADENTTASSNRRNSSQSPPPANASRRGTTTSSSLILPSIDADILTRMGMLSQQGDTFSRNSTQQSHMQRTPVRPSLASNVRNFSSVSGRALYTSSTSSSFVENHRDIDTVNTLRRTVRQARAHYICR